MRKISTMQLLPGMVTAEDVFGLNDQLLLPKGTALTDSVISMLDTYGIYNIKITDTAKGSPLPDYSLSYFTRIQNRPEFQKFKSDYEMGLSAFKENINAVITKNVSLNVGEMYEQTLIILSSTLTGTSVFDMLNNMREYDDSTFSHSLNVALICNVLAQWLKMSEKDVELATTCGLFHDIGKIQVPKEIIAKPGKLSDIEYDIIKKHPISGYKILLDQKIDDNICYAALMHHERCDGSGYPLGLKDRKINKFAKLVAIADVYDAMTAARVYRGPMCPFKVIELFEREGLQKYEPEYIMTFLENVVNTYISNRCRLSDGQEGNIIYINKDNLSRPMVQCGKNYINLAEQMDLHIECIL